jgi:hypothetical protein
MGTGLFDACTQERHQYLNIGIAAIMVVVAIWQLSRIRRRNRTP